MTSARLKWLPHLENAVPTKGYGNRLSMYLIALEAWRRGLKVKFYTIDNPDNKMLIRYSLANEKNVYHFESSRGEKLTRYAYDVCENKDDTKKILAKAGIPVPEGKRFEENATEEEIISYANKLGFPIVIKPISENAGKGVFSNINTESELRASVEYVRNELHYKDIIIEKHIDGVEHRIFIVDGKVLGVVNRIPANIIGDGKNTVEQLMKQKNRSKKFNPNLSSKIIELDKEVIDSIQQSGYRLDSIPEKGRQIFLRSKSNVSMGGDPIDVTDQLTDELKELATKAANSIPGLDICGLDMIIDKEKNTGVIIEINTKPMIGLHVFPVKGRPRDVVSPILDYYFPETINSNKTNLYFDFDAALAPLRAKLVREIEIAPPPTLENIYAKCYTISGPSVDSDYRSWIRLEALKNNLHGYIEELNDQKVQIIVASENEKKVQGFKTVCMEGLRETENHDVIEKEYTKPVKIGFEVYSIPRLWKTNQKLRKNLDDEKLKGKKLKRNAEKLKRDAEKLKLEKEKQTLRLNRKIKRKEQKIKQLKKEKSNIIIEKDKIKKEYSEVLSSQSWKLTKPLRKINSLFK